MKISYKWLRQFIEMDWPAEKTAELLTDLGLEVEGITPFESVPGGLKGIVVGEVKSCEKHPNADKLSLCQVDIGADKPVQIVCGAPNVAKGQKVPVATIGTTLYTADGEPWKIKKGKIRGEASHGMICAEDEIGLGDSHDGILVLDTDAAPGTPCAELFQLEEDEVFEIGLTPNRADAMSHYGVARDLRAGLKQQKISKELITPSVSNFHVDNRSGRIEVQVEKPELAPRYCGVTISNLIVQESPDWLRNRLRAIGLSPINNVVDATNYVLHELGQPLHAFDADRIHGKKILVKTVKAGTKFMTLDGEERILHEEDLMICDAEKPMCIAGVFGGINTGVTMDTRNIFLESAYFDPVSIRKTAKRHGLNTDASFRFERGIDINNVEYALLRAAILIRDIAGGEISSDAVDLYPKKMPDHNVFLTYEKIYRLVGTEIPRDTVISILASLDIQVKSVTESGLGLVIPFYRVDVRREVDVIEEILRVYGYNNIPDKSQFTASIEPPAGVAPHKLQDRISGRLAALGFDEILGNSLCNPAHNALLGGDPEGEVALMNPLSQELSALRRDLLFSGLGAISHNLNRRQQDLRLYEFGQIYSREGTQWEERERLALLLTGNQHPDHWENTAKPQGFFDLKAVVAHVLDSLGAGPREEMPVTDQRFSEALEISMGKRAVVRLGSVHPDILRAFDIRQEVLYADIDWPLLLQGVQGAEISYTEIPRHPEVRRDLALLLDESVSFRQLHDLALKTNRKILRDVRLFDVYTGDKLPAGKKSYALSFFLQDPKKTLADKQIDSVMGSLQKAFENELGAELRG
ncbi:MULTISPECIES: phenylalanine--tRNA ligase subunit beta [unclassified Robiginitalea]|uniref:phenylalanine--tRNA ligase subunit beta n=1 Tax=Robiginitalea TaxID=252306 RepID=UPI0023499070|nr:MULTISPECIES: phenylalanine--tRNA ligase subunit beta [unclassified Robiginitalea]MDC6354232.1 phenylalanine--tRNA ligase subunit beta [Robiginitalea sp. PM2]MDC6374499.1 phenylalanine--tRNA ligase subunit beta [Robiginitalea sp. SP8]